MINLNWYFTLDQPPLTPPSWVFVPVWSMLYTMILISFVLFIVKRTDESKTFGYILFFSQIALNFVWIPVFFIFHKITLAFVILLLLNILVYLNIIEFYYFSKKAAYFLIPYFIWILFAAYLNAGVLVLN